jgi:hypothetical protein
MLLFIYIQSTLNIYWCISIQIHWQQLYSTICNIWSAIRLAIMKVILNYLLLPSRQRQVKNPKSSLVVLFP